jgi:hypothetical protein
MSFLNARRLSIWTLLLAAAAPMSRAGPPIVPAEAAQSADNHSAPPATLPQVTIRARRELERRTTQFVAKVTGPLNNDDAIQRWQSPICLAVAGLPKEEGEKEFARLAHTLVSLGLPPEHEGCRPNFIVVVTPDPAALLNAAPAYLFGGQVGLHAFITTPRPVRIWYNAVLTSEDGSLLDPSTGETPLGAVPTYRVLPVSPRAEYWMWRRFVSIVAVVDLTRVVGYDWRQVTDYIVMTGLTRVNPDADFGDAPTILRLFSSPDKDRLMSLSDWDRAFLKELYASSTSERSQRLRIVHRMTRDITS